jgi:hypothetical protein
LRERRFNCVAGAARPFLDSINAIVTTRAC